MTTETLSWLELRRVRAEAAIAEPDPFRRELLKRWASAALINSMKRLSE